MKYNYDTLAPIYDRLSRLVFGRVQVDAQLYLLDAIPAGARILIIGGGTGWILDAIVARHLAGLAITYVDASAKMITLARKRDVKNNHITFINATIEDSTPQGPFDIILTPFLFDNLREEDVPKVISTVEAALAPNALWLYCDFRHSSKLLHRLLLKSMYVFVRLVCGIKASRLAEVRPVFTQLHWVVVRETLFFDGMIEAVVYGRV